MFHMKVECPRCGKIWTVPQGTSDVTCDCHLYCEEGEKQGDCNLTTPPDQPDRFTAFVGLKVGSPADQYESPFTYRKWCTVHNRITYKAPIILECNWQEWFSKRAPRKLRMSQGLY